MKNFFAQFCIYLIGPSASEAAVLCCRLAIVALLTQRLPVVSVPEQSLVASVRLDVIDYCRRHRSACLAHTLSAERMVQ